MLGMLRSTVHFLAGALRVVVGLALVFGALALGFVAATGVLLRLAWLRARDARSRPPRGVRARAAGGEVIDAVVREIRAR